MHLADIMAARPVTGAGVLVMTTSRCPLRCAHCSTASTMAGPDADAVALGRFFGTFTPERRPAIAMLTGGEPLLRPALVAELARTAATVGTRTAVLTGAYFARAARIPDAVLHAIDAVDHCSISLDAFHEREVARADVFRALRRIMDRSIEVSLHIVGTGPDDPYLAAVTAEVRREFGHRVPMLVSEVAAAGRAATWAAAPGTAAGAELAAEPCAMAAWPVVAVDGTVTACCNQQVVDATTRPDHLRLGHVATDGWADIVERALSSPVLRMIRTVGPRLVAAGGGADAGSTVDYCGTCRGLDARPEALAWAAATGGGAAGALLDWFATRRQAEAGPAALVRRYGCGPYAGLIEPDPSRRAVR